MLLPAAISAAASYVTFAALVGTEPILPVAGQPPFNLVDLGGAAVVGLVAGLLARVFILLVQAAKRQATRGHGDDLDGGGVADARTLTAARVAIMPTASSPPPPTTLLR